MSGPEHRRDAEWAAQQDIFRKRHFIRFERFVDPRVLARLRPMMRVADEQLQTKVHRQGDRLLAQEASRPGRNAAVRLRRLVQGKIYGGSLAPTQRRRE